MREIKKFHKESSRRVMSCRVKRREGNWIGEILWRNCLLTYVIEGKIEGKLGVTGRRLRRSKHLMGDLKEKRGYWKYK